MRLRVRVSVSNPNPTPNPKPNFDPNPNPNPNPSPGATAWTRNAPLRVPHVADPQLVELVVHAAVRQERLEHGVVEVDGLG